MSLITPTTRSLVRIGQATPLSITHPGRGKIQGIIRIHTCLGFVNLDCYLCLNMSLTWSLLITFKKSEFVKKLIFLALAAILSAVGNGSMFVCSHLAKFSLDAHASN